MRRLLNAIVVGLSCALCSSALADDRADPIVLLLGLPESQQRLIDDEELAQLRGRLAIPAVPQQPSVILWDEPRRGAPPPRTDAPAGAAQVNTVYTIYRK